MIFGILVLLWIHGATQSWMLLLPVVLIVLRENYLDRKLRYGLIWIPLVVSLFSYLYMAGVSKLPGNLASLSAGKIFVSALILIQLTYGLLRNGPSYGGKHLGTLLLFTQRCLILEKRMMTNARYSFKVRRHSSGIFSRETVNLLGGILLTATSEFLRLADDLWSLYRSRGSNPVTKGWVVPQSRTIPISYGDLVLILLIGILVWISLNQLIPSGIYEIYNLTFRL